MMVGILGFAQTGKDTVSDLLAEEGFVRMAFADPLKRMVRELFDFTYEQMWGTLEEKEAPDLRYPREHTWGGTGTFSCLCCGTKFFPVESRDQCYLNGRYALKVMGTEGARHCYGDIWGERTIKDARAVLNGWNYDKLTGITSLRLDEPRGVIFTDCRFENEVRRIQDASGWVFRLKRPGYEKPMFDHPSETEQLRIPDSKLQGVIENDGTLEDLKRKVLELLGLPARGIMAARP